MKTFGPHRYVTQRFPPSPSRAAHYSTEVVVDTRARSGGFEQVALALLRVMAGLMFMEHGLQKLFGMLGGYEKVAGATAPFLSQDWIGGNLETFGGLLIVLGLFTRPVGFLLAGYMAVAYFMVHAPNGFYPMLNNGEKAALYSFVFFYFFAAGGGRYSLDALLARRRQRGGEAVAEPANRAEARARAVR
jgi:putative oxidoreductase